jgi:hypothetical protein
MRIAASLFAVSVLVGSLSAALETHVGVVTDTMCGANHAPMKVSPDSKCVLECVKHGSKYALLEGTKVYTLSDQETPAKFAGQKVKVTGQLYEKTGILKVETIEAVK